MSDQSAILSLPYILPSQAQKHVTHNEALRLLDLAVQLSVKDRDRTAPPAAPEAGDRHIVASGGSGDWAGQDGAVALYAVGEGWVFTPPLPGWRAYVEAEAAMAVWDGIAWQSLAPEFQNLDGVGVNTGSDAVNRLAVASEASLFSHEGAGHQVKVNKAAVADTASLLFQTAWSGRAEMGIAGSDDFSIKVSADGATWHTGLSILGGDGQASLPNGVTTPALSGLAVQQDAQDTTPGRVMRADWGYSAGNLLGLVAQSGGVPTGAVIETGNNSSGSYTRFADGTQICAPNVELQYQSSGHLQQDWVLPAAFDGGFSTALGILNAGPSIGTMTPGLDQIGSVMWSNSGSNNTTARLSVRRNSDAPDFQAGDKAFIKTVAFGRWF